MRDGTLKKSIAKCVSGQSLRESMIDHSVAKGEGISRDQKFCLGFSGEV